MIVHNKKKTISPANIKIFLLLREDKKYLAYIYIVSSLTTSQIST